MVRDMLLNWNVNISIGPSMQYCRRSLGSRPGLEIQLQGSAYSFALRRIPICSSAA